MGTKSMSISFSEFGRSFRDMAIFSGAAFSVEVLDALSLVDFGDYEAISVIIISGLIAMLNRFLRDAS